MNIREMARIKVPIIVTITGEGGSGGALAIAVGDEILMMEHAIYSVISPEGCAAILWKDAGRAEEAADGLRLTAPDLLELGLVDRIVPEPVGGRSYGASTRPPKCSTSILSKRSSVRSPEVAEERVRGALRQISSHGRDRSRPFGRPTRHERRTDTLRQARKSVCALSRLRCVRRLPLCGRVCAVERAVQLPTLSTNRRIRPRAESSSSSSIPKGAPLGP